VVEEESFNPNVKNPEVVGCLMITGTGEGSTSDENRESGQDSSDESNSVDGDGEESDSLQEEESARSLRWLV